MNAAAVLALGSVEQRALALHITEDNLPVTTGSEHAEGATAGGQAHTGAHAGHNTKDNHAAHNDGSQSGDVKVKKTPEGDVDISVSSHKTSNQGNKRVSHKAAQKQHKTDHNEAKEVGNTEWLDRKSVV